MQRSRSSRPAALGRSLAAIVAFVVVGVACGGGSDSAPSSSDSTTTSSSTTTSTIAPTTVATTAPPTTVPAPPVYPLTGLPAADPAIAARPALVVKIDNATGARPQTGFNAADMVYEELVNDGLTRFAMVFQSGDSDPVGPVRSGRIQDIDLFGSLNRPLFAWSGGNETVTAAINASDLVNLGPSKARVYYRDPSRAVPHNLYSKTSDLFEQAPAGAAPPVLHWQFRAAGAPATGTPAAGVDVRLDAVDVTWRWDPSAAQYRRQMEGRPHQDAGPGRQVTTDNVVVLVMEYASGISGSPDAQSVGRGEAFVFTAGTYQHGTWTRTDRLLPFTLAGDDGTPITLTPGRTFVELPRSGETTPVAA